MATWLQYLIALAVLIVVAPLAAWAAIRSGRVKGGIALAGLLLGFGEAADPPSKHLIEAGHPEEKESPTPGDPPKIS